MIVWSVTTVDGGPNVLVFATEELARAEAADIRTYLNERGLDDRPIYLQAHQIGEPK